MKKGGLPLIMIPQRNGRMKEPKISVLAEKKKLGSKVGLPT